MNSFEEFEEVNISLIHQINGSHLDIHLIHCIDVMYGFSCNMDENREITSQVNLCMYFYASLILAELCTWTKFEAHFDITQAVLVSILRHAHYKKLIVTGKIPYSIITPVPGEYFVEFSTRYELHDLSENCFAGLHSLRYLTGNAKVTNSKRVQEIQDAYY